VQSIATIFISLLQIVAIALTLTGAATLITSISELTSLNTGRKTSYRDRYFTLFSLIPPEYAGMLSQIKIIQPPLNSLFTSRPIILRLHILDCRQLR
jgi:hypothetical protein